MIRFLVNNYLSSTTKIPNKKIIQNFLSNAFDYNIQVKLEYGWNYFSLSKVMSFNCKMENFWFLCSNFYFIQSNVFIFLHNVYDHNTQRSSENLIIIPFMVTELCFLLEKWQFCCFHPLISDFLWQALRCFLQNVCALNTHVKINFDYSFLRFKRYASVYVN